MLPRILKNYMLFIDGIGYAGKVPEIKLPKLSRKMEEYSGGGMDGSVEIDLGQEKLEAEFTLAEYNSEVLKLYGLNDANGAILRFKAAALADDASEAVDAIEIVMRGRWKELDRDAVKPRDKAFMKTNVAVAYYKETVNDQELIEIDTINMVLKVNGVDRLQQQREALGLA